MNFETQLVHFDSAPGDPHRPTSTPIYQTATFEQDLGGEGSRYDYSRSGNPTRSVLEAQLARLEGAEHAFAYASGMAAVAATCRLLSPGDELLAGVDLYGGTYRFLSRVLEPNGVVVRFVDTTDLGAVAAALNARTRLLLLETPSNPLQRVSDLRALAALTHDNGALLAVDASISSPYLQRPIELGADIVLHSATKVLSGHSDLTAGVVATRDAELAARLAFSQNAEGTALAPFESWLLLRGQKTLALRLERQQATAAVLARYLSEHPLVSRVHFVGLRSHPGHELHHSQARGPGSVLAFETGDLELSHRILAGTDLFATTVSFGGVGSSISLPCAMSHASIPAEVRRARDFPEDLVRLSAGIEDPEDLLADLERAFAHALTQV